jgi:hypothetical protein
MVDDKVFFINTENHVIFYLYDDRGLDIVAYSHTSKKVEARTCLTRRGSRLLMYLQSKHLVSNRLLLVILDPLT